LVAGARLEQTHDDRFTVPAIPSSNYLLSNNAFDNNLLPVSSLVDNIINPLVGLALGKVNLADKMTVIGNASIKWGAFISTIVDFVIIAAVVYFGIKALGLDKLDKKKE
jgi:large conductance mechanosensitive channel protein